MNKKTKKQKMLHADKIAQSHKLDYILLAIFAITISILLFFRGGYFEKEMLRNLILVYIMFLLFILTKVRSGSAKIFETPMDILLFGIVMMYALSMTYGVNKRASLIEFSKYMAFFCIYILGRYLSRLSIIQTKNSAVTSSIGDVSLFKYKNIIINITLLTGLAISIIGIGAGAGAWEIAGAVVGNRISSTLQYPNTLAAYVSALYLLSLMMINISGNKIFKGVYGAFLGTFLFSLLITQSRAMWLMFPIAVILYFVVVPNTRKMETIVYGILSVMASVPMAFLYISAISEPSLKLWLYFVVASIGTATLVYLTSMLEERFRGVSVKKLIFSLVGLVVIVVGVVVYVMNQTVEIKLSANDIGIGKQYISRSVSDIYPNTDYELRIKYDGERKSEDQPVGTVKIYYLDESGETKHIKSKYLIDLTGEKTIKFKTLNNTKTISIYFSSEGTETSIVIYNVDLIEMRTDKLVKNLPLKYKYIPEDIAVRFGAISSSDESANARVIFNKDGLKIVKHYPILGAGGSGWVSLYQKYQSYPYWTKLAHNFFLQLWIEVGTIGLLMLVAFLVFLNIFAYRTYRKTEQISNKVYIAGVYSSLFTILIHALVDFDMSLVGYALVFWALVGVLVGSVNTESFTTSTFKINQKILNSKLVYYSVAFIALALIFNSWSILSTSRYLDRGVEASDNNDIDGIIENYEKAASRDSLKSSIKIDLANAYKLRYGMFEDTTDMDRAYDLTEEYLKLAPTDGLAQSYGSEFFFNVGEIDKGIELANRVVELNPMRSDSYLYKLDAYSLVAKYFYENGDVKGAKTFLQDGLAIKGQIKEVNEKALKPVEQNDDLVKKVGELNFMLKNIDILDDIEEDNGSVVFAYNFDVDINDDGIPDMLYSYAPLGSLLKIEALTENDENYLRITNDSEVYGTGYITPITLESNTDYRVKLKLRGNISPETLVFHVWSQGAESPEQGRLAHINITENWQTLSFDFTTDTDIAPEQQQIWIYHNGNDKGHVDIKDIVIFER